MKNKSEVLNMAEDEEETSDEDEEETSDEE